MKNNHETSGRTDQDIATDLAGLARRKDGAIRCALFVLAAVVLFRSEIADVVVAFWQPGAPGTHQPVSGVNTNIQTVPVQVVVNCTGSASGSAIGSAARVEGNASTRIHDILAGLQDSASVIAFPAGTPRSRAGWGGQHSCLAERFL